MINLIWDLDGTLIDSMQECSDTIYKALKIAGIDTSKQIAPYRSGPPLDVILHEMFLPQDLSDKQISEVIKQYRSIYDNSDFSKTPAFPGIAEIIHDAKNFTHYVITNKPDLPSKRILEKLGFAKHIKRLVTPYTFGAEKRLSKSELFTGLIQEEKLDKSRTFGIGDMWGDEMAAHSAGIKAIGVLWGTGTREELAVCDWIVRDARELMELLSALID